MRLQFLNKLLSCWIEFCLIILSRTLLKSTGESVQRSTFKKYSTASRCKTNQEGFKINYTYNFINRANFKKILTRDLNFLTLKAVQSIYNLYYIHLSQAQFAVKNESVKVSP